MKAACLFLFTWIFLNLTHGQSLEWISTIGDVASDQGKSITTDSFGNIYATGSFRGKVDVRPGPDTFFLYSVPNQPAVYVVKYNRFGDLIWAKALGSGIGLDIALDHAGFVDVVGSFTGSSDFDPGIGVIPLTSNGLADIFICQLSNDGVFQWAEGFGGPETDQVNAIAISPDNDIYMTGFFRNSVDVDPGIPVEILTSSGETDAFVQKLSHAGIHIWTRQFGSSFFDTGSALRLANSGNLIVAGNFHGMIDFDPGSGTHTLIADDSLDVFICSLTGAGFFVWAKNFGGVDDVIAVDLAIDHLDNILLAGYFKNTADFNPDLGYAHLTSLGGTDIFLSKLDATANFLWVKQLGGVGPADEVHAITLDDVENIYLAGGFVSICDVDPGPTTHYLTSASSTDMFLVKLDATAQFLSAHQIGGPASDIVEDVAIDDNGKAYLTGTFTDNADFSPGRDAVVIQSHGGQDAFIVRMNFFPFLSDFQGPRFPCADDTAHYSINAENVNQFNWTFPSNWQIVGSSNNDSVTVITNSIGGSIMVTASGQNGSSFPLFLNVDPVSKPTLSGLTGVYSPCPGELKTYSVQSLDVDSISWIFPSDWEIIGSAHNDSIKVIVGVMNGMVKVTGHNECGDTSLQHILVTQKSPLLTGIVGDLTPCVGDTITYRAQQMFVKNYQWSFPAGWEVLSVNDSISVKVVVSDHSGQITIVGTNVCGDTSWTSAVNPFIVPDATILVNMNQLSIQPAGQSYQWFFNSAIIPGAIQNSYLATQSGSYTAKVTYASGCIAFTDAVEIIITGINEVNINELNVFPVPAKEKIYMQGFASEFEFVIYDLTGKKLMVGKTANGEISILQLRAGSYIIQAEKNGVRGVARLVKE